jgi:hypothetical protein
LKNIPFIVGKIPARYEVGRFLDIWMLVIYAVELPLFLRFIYQVTFSNPQVHTLVK